MDKAELQERMTTFAVRIVKMVDSMPTTVAGHAIAPRVQGIIKHHRSLYLNNKRAHETKWQIIDRIYLKLLIVNCPMVN